MNCRFFRSVVSRYIIRASHSWYSLLYNWPPNHDLLLNNSLLELIYFLSMKNLKRKYKFLFVHILLTQPDSFPPSLLWHWMSCKNVNVALVEYLYQEFYDLNTLYGTCVTWKFWFTNEILKRRLEKALLTEQIEHQILFCTVTSQLLHDDAKIHATLARLYNVLENWREMKTVFCRNILIQTEDLLILFDILVRYD